MLESYYSVVFAVLLLTFPLASKKLAYSSVTDVYDYSPLRGLSSQGRHVAWFGAIAIIVILVILCVFKSENLPDTEMYRLMFDMGGGERINRDIEPSFGLLARIAPTFAILLLLYAVLSVSFHVFGIFRNSPNIWLSLLLYLPYTYVLHDLIQIRAAVAIGIMLIAVRFIVERKWILYFSCVAIAYFFHYSAIIFILFYFLPHKYLNKWIWSSLLVVATIGGLMNSQFGYLAKFVPLEIVQMYFENYMGSKNYTASEIGPVRIFQVICSIIMLFNQKKITEAYPLAIPMLIFFIMSQLSYMLLSDIPVLQGRFGEMFAAFDIYSLAMFPLMNRKYYYILWIVPIFFIIYNHMLVYGFIEGAEQGLGV